MSQTSAAPQQNKQTSIVARVVNAFMQAAVYTFKVQCQYEIKYEKAEQLLANSKIVADVCANIGMNSDAFQGTITLVFSEKLYLAVVNSMFGEAHTVLNDELVDGAAELLNIIFGGAKTTLTNEGHSVMMSIPTVVSGKNLKINNVTGGGTTIVIQYATANGPFYMLVSLGKTKDKA